MRMCVKIIYMQVYPSIYVYEIVISVRVLLFEER